jgi:hypothetical protein
MAKLTDTQLIVLSTAAAREDGLAAAPARMNKAAAAKVGSSLVARKLMREVRAKPGMPVWREDEDGRGVSLMVTRAGRDAIGVGDESAARSEAAQAQAKQKKSPAKATADSKEPIRTGMASSVALSPRDGSKQALVIGMLSAKRGATIDALVDATGWLPHTTRAALTGLRKRGFAIERSRAEGETSVYRIVGSPPAAAA